jgi:ferredoxin-fold anticodon binding domain-containing protein
MKDFYCMWDSGVYYYLKIKRVKTWQENGLRKWRRQKRRRLVAEVF